MKKIGLGLIIGIIAIAVIYYFTAGSAQITIISSSLLMIPRRSLDISIPRVQR